MLIRPQRFDNALKPLLEFGVVVLRPGEVGGEAFLQQNAVHPVLGVAEKKAVEVQRDDDLLILALAQAAFHSHASKEPLPPAVAEVLAQL